MNFRDTHIKSSFLRIITFCFFLLSLSTANAQQIAPELTRRDHSAAGITLDGNLDEPVWSSVAAFNDMRVIQPDTLETAPLDTQTQVFYTERGIYLGITNQQDPATLLARLSSRDVRMSRDSVLVGIDASGAGLYGYIMRIALGGSMNDATLLPEKLMNIQWDGSWNAITSETAEGWVAEVFIPWSMMSLPQSANERQIGLYIERDLGQVGETWSWPPLPATSNEFISGFQKFQVRDIAPTTQLTHYPYSSATFNNIKNELKYRVGTEIYWRPTTNMQISATINPDFGNVESDDVVVNLTAFEVFFPEKRAFFLEGQEIFNTSPRSRGGRGPGGPTTLLNTRRIGRAPSFLVPSGVSVVPTDLSQPSELLGAAKLTGQNGNWRYGTLLAAEDDSEIRGFLDDGTRVSLQAKGRDFTIARLLYEDTSNGDRRAFGWMGTNLSHPDRDATVNGLDFHYFSSDSRWVVDGQLMHSDVDGETGAGGFTDLIFRPVRGRQHRVSATYIDDSLNINDLGFLSRNDYWQFDYNYSIDESNIPGIRSRNTSFQFINQWNTSGQPVRLGFFANRNYSFLDNTSLRLGMRYFNPRIDDRLGRGSGEFRIPERWSMNLGWDSDPSQVIAYALNVNANQGDLGRKNLGTSIIANYRPRDYFSVELELGYTVQEALLVYQGSGRYTSFESTQWAPKLNLDYFITAKQQFRFSMQWNALKAFEDKFWQVNPVKLDYLQEISKPDTEPDDFIISRMTFQARYRWEIAPLSDLFVVYTRGSNLPGNTFDEYSQLFSQSWTDRVVDSLVIKLRYRLGA